MSEWFPLSSVAPDQNAATSRLCHPLAALKAGTYANGLLTVLSVSDSTQMLEGWTDASAETICLAITGLGDAFFWDGNNKAVYFLDSQHATYTFIDSDIEWFFSEYLLKDGVQRTVLKADIYFQIAKRLDFLKYGEIFFPVPYLVLGGAGDIDSYKKGGAKEYFSLLIQTIGINNIQSTD